MKKDLITIDDLIGAPEITPDVFDFETGPVENYFRTKEGFEWNINHKILALMFMETHQTDGKEERVPKYSMISRTTGVPEPTLTRWWGDKDKIMMQESEVIGKAIAYASYLFSVGFMKMAQSVAKRDFEKMKDTDLIKFVDTISNKLMLFAKLPTKITQTVHSGQVAVVPQINPVKEIK